MSILQLSTSIIIKEELLDILFENKDINPNLNKKITNIFFDNKNTMSKKLPTL